MHRSPVPKCSNHRTDLRVNLSNKALDSDISVTSSCQSSTRLWTVPHAACTWDLVVVAQVPLLSDQFHSLR